jgi:hypothetical protein
MQNDELDEKVTIMEELMQGFVGRMNVVETGMAEFSKAFLDQYRSTLESIAARIETANKGTKIRKSDNISMNLKPW